MRSVCLTSQHVLLAASLFLCLRPCPAVVATDGSFLNYTWSPRAAGKLDPNAQNLGVTYHHEPPSSLNCSYISPTGNAPTTGTVTYAFQAIPGRLIQAVTISQRAVIYTNGHVTGEISTNGGGSWTAFFDTPPFTGSAFHVDSSPTLTNLNSPTLLVRYTLSVTTGFNYNIQLCRDCDDAPLSLKFVFNSPVSIIPVPRNLRLGAGPGGTVSANPDQPIFDPNTPVTVTAQPEPGFVFAGWVGDVVSRDNPLSVVMNQDKTLTAYFAAIGQATNCVPPFSGLVGWWSGNGHPGDLVKGNNAVLKNGLNYGVGNVDAAFQFDGIDDYLQVGQPALPLPWTAIIWVKRQNGQQASAALLSSDSYALKVEQFRTARQVGLTHYGVADWSFNYSVPTNQWTQLAFVGIPGITLLYVNGALTDSISVSFPLPLDRFGIGVTNPPTDVLSGLLDEIAVFNRALTSTEIAQNFNLGKAGFCKPPRFFLATKSAAGELRLHILGQMGKEVTLFQSSEPKNWFPYIRLENPQGLLDITLPFGPASTFFRASSGP